MIRLPTAVLLFVSVNVAAQECPGFSPSPEGTPTKCDLNQLNNNEVADADKVMENFNKLGDAVDALPTPPTNCTADQIIMWDDTNDAWVCATDPFAGLNCDVGDQLRMGSGGWECRAEPITARLTQDSWDVSVEYGKISTYFDTYLNIDPDLYCNHANVPGAAACAIRVLGVSDHNSCIAEVSGGAVEGMNASVDISVDGGLSYLLVGTTWTWYSGEPVSIDIICAP